MKLAHTVALPVLAFAALATITTFAQCGDGVAPTKAPAAQDPQPPVPPAGADTVRILVSGSLLGHLEPCGCSSGQLGGLARRMQHIAEQRTYDVLLEGGDLLDGTDELAQAKLFVITQVLGQMAHPYDAIGIAPNDLRLPLDQWSMYASMATFVASDLASERPDWPFKPFVEKQVRGKTLRIGSLALALPDGLRGADAGVTLRSPGEGWAAAMAGAGDDTLRILLLHTTETAARKLVPGLAPAPDLVVCCDEGYSEPETSPVAIGKSLMVVAGIRGRVLLDVKLARQAQGPTAVCEPVPLTGSRTVPGGGGDPDVKQALLDHRNQVKADSLREKLARQRPTTSGASYVGNELCRGCHASAYTAWEATRHGHAWATLEKAEADPKKYGWPVTAYPECVGCHTVGYREQTGFVSPEETPQLENVGCERCHGPASAHIASNGTARLGILDGAQPSLLCVQCHDYEQSPTFSYNEAWAKIVHGREPGQRAADQPKPK